MTSSNEQLTNEMLQVGAGIRYLGKHDPSFREVATHSLSVIRRALDKFAPSSLAISFNGGKDACVVLYMLMAVLAERGQLDCLIGAPPTDGHSSQPRIEIVYFEKQEFPAVFEFLDKMAHTYGFRYRRYPQGCSYKEGMQELVTNHGIEAVFMGQRFGDPWTDGMDEFAQSTPGWPSFIRINPILRWKFGHVWKFLKGCGLAYCRIYDEGYTSLGEAHDTEPNPSLRRPDGSYKAAWQLVDEDLERAFRRCRRASAQPLEASSMAKLGTSGDDGSSSVASSSRASLAGSDASASCSDCDEGASVASAGTSVASEPPDTPLGAQAKENAAAAAGREALEPAFAGGATAVVNTTPKMALPLAAAPGAGAGGRSLRQGRLPQVLKTSAPFVACVVAFIIAQLVHAKLTRR